MEELQETLLVHQQLRGATGQSHIHWRSYLARSTTKRLSPTLREEVNASTATTLRINTHTRKGLAPHLQHAQVTYLSRRNRARSPSVFLPLPCSQFNRPQCDGRFTKQNAAESNSIILLLSVVRSVYKR